MKKTEHSDSPEATRALAAAFWGELQPGDVVALHGDLGVGKTCFVQGLVQEGAKLNAPVASPTYTLIQEYDGPLPIYHIDLYRLAEAASVWSLGIDEYLFGDGVTVIEWPERAEGVLPDDAWHIQIEMDGLDSGRTLTFRKGTAA
jgi:tRNA threonylcarbamoyladenosine biosynthesis protein TsaE